MAKMKEMYSVNKLVYDSLVTENSLHSEIIEYDDFQEYFSDQNRAETDVSVYINFY